MLGAVTLALDGPQVRPPARLGWSGKAPETTRAPVCRRTGCSAPAGGDGLCPVHHGRQLAARAAVEARSGVTSSHVPVPAWLAEVAAAREAPWRARAACRGMTAAMYAVAERGRPADYGAALALCGECPVVEACRAAGAHEPEGVWGGTTPAERHPRRRACRVA
jgi:WhiB family redox-sensing transcriptional regulator